MPAPSVRQGTPAAAPQVAAPQVAAPQAPQAIAMPTTRRQLDMIEMQRSALSDQLTSAQGRRSDVQRQIARATSPADRAGLESRLAVLDTRIAQLERDIDVTGRQVSSPEAAAIRATSEATGGRWGNLSTGQTTAITIVGLLTIGLPLSLAFGRVLWRRARVPAAPPGRELTERLDRLEQGIDAVAIEVERISEGQRFVNKLLSEGAARRVAVPAAERLEAGRDPADARPSTRG